MDNGPLQKEQALKIKRVVGQNNRRRRQNHRACSSHLPFPGMDVLDAGSLEISAPKAKVTSDQESTDVPASSSASGGPVLVDWADFDSWSTSNLDFSISTAADNLNDPQLNFDQVACVEDQLKLDVPTETNHNIYPDAPGTGGYSGSRSSPSLDISERPADCEILDLELHAEMNQGFLTNSAAETQLFNHTSSVYLPHPHGSVLSFSRPDTLDSAVSQDEMDDSLLMHYLDEVFHVQFPFYNVPNRGSRGWLLSTIRRTRSVYYATLALSQCHLESAAECPLSLPSKASHLKLAEESLEAIQGEIGKSSTLPRITCVLQMLFYRVCWVPNHNQSVANFNVCSYSRAERRTGNTCSA